MPPSEEPWCECCGPAGEPWVDPQVRRGLADRPQASSQLPVEPRPTQPAPAAPLSAWLAGHRG